MNKQLSINDFNVVSTNASWATCKPSESSFVPVDLNLVQISAS